MTEPTNAEIRQWARAQGMPVADRGRLPAHLVEAYAVAHAAPDHTEPAYADVASPAQPPPLPAATGPAPAASDLWSGPAAAQPPQSQAAGPQIGPTAGSPFGPPPAWAYGQPPPRQPGTDGFAIASFVLGLLSGVLLSVIFGVLALKRIKKTGGDGRGLAIAGLVLSALWTVGIVIAVVATSTAERDATGSFTSSGDVSVEDLRIRDCTGPLPEDDVFTVRVLPCSASHDAEVYAIVPLDGEDYPGDVDVVRFAEGGCSREIEQLLADDPTPYELSYFHPTQESWSTGDRTVICLLVGPRGEPLVGSVVERAGRPT